MRIAFVSNFFNHHQMPLSEAMAAIEGVKYSFIETSEIPQERIALGYGNEELPDYVAPFVAESLRDKAGMPGDLALANIAIIGSVPDDVARKCIRTSDLVFRYSERPLKNGAEPHKFLPRLIKWRFQNASSKPFCLLCASAYTAGDYAKFGLFKNRSYKWGYFPELRRHDLDDLFSRKDPTKIIWVGRFLDWKHPDDALIVLERLRDDGYRFSLDFVGTGPMEETLRRKVVESGLSDEVRFLGPMPPGEVRDRMEESGVLLFTSDQREGWGAVLNEAMNSGCAVVASHLAGSTPYLVNDGENGLVYHSGDMDELARKVGRLLDSPDRQRCLGEAAYRTISEVWNAEVAVERLINLAKRILAGEEHLDLYENGPCSRAGLLGEDWYKGEA